MALKFFISLVLFGAASVTCAEVHEHGSTADLYDRAITEVWRSSDRNEDGVFSTGEMLLGFANFDENSDGRVSRKEYVDFVVHPNPELKEFSHYLFNSYDVNSDHHIDGNDFAGLQRAMDLDHDGVVSKTDFYHYWYQLLQDTAHLHGHGSHLTG
ncbi:uncharacterized protein LOC126815514 [Patella vulgata]|uniref:uncharacterized protein LOC126815514 n=1 Tax=Patella vulgata TaxID=6465 RepID=UPI00217FD657|nr:uncharacterized protein LOC126815514 [Patella vulgata]